MTFTFTRGEYIRAMRNLYVATLSIKRDVIISVLMISAGLYLVYHDAGWFGWLLIALSVILLCLIAFAVFVLPVLIYRGQPKLKDEYRLSFSDECIQFRTVSIDSTLQWSMYQKWRYDDEFYILHHGQHDVSVLPRRALRSRADDDQLRAMLERHIGPAC